MVKITKNIKTNFIQTIISNRHINYSYALDFMEHRVKNIIDNNESELIWLLSHPNIYTFGNTSKKEDFISKPSIPIFKTNRGGQITYHGPGQRIAYFMIDLNKRKKDIKYFIKIIENIAIQTLKEFDVIAESRKNRIGIWVTKVKNNKLNREKKIGAIGIRIKKWVTYHGISLNINPNLDFFKNINPCGITNYEVTSLKDLGLNVNIKDFDKILLYHSKKILNS